MKEKKVLIIGDTILDEYIYVKGLGKPSMENIVAGLYNDKELFLGGVFSSVGNLSSFCDNIDFITSTGNEEKYKKFIRTNIPKNIGNLNCFLAFAYGIVDAVNKDTKPITKGIIELLKSLIIEYFMPIITEKTNTMATNKFEKR